MSDNGTVVRIAFLGLLQTIQKASWRDVVSSHTDYVFASRAKRTAIRALQDQLDKAGEGPIQLRWVGYSWGGWSAIGLARRLCSSPASLHPRLATDPWTLRLGLLDPVRTLRRRVMLPTDERVRCWNVYQRNGCHSGCTGHTSWYRGEPVQGAENRDVTEDGRARPMQDNVPPSHAPDHVQLGVYGWDQWDERIASVLAGATPW